MKTVVLASVMAIAACGDNNNAPADAHTDASNSGHDAAIDAPGMEMITLNGGANGLYWDAASSKLYFTDDTNAKWDSWDDANGVQVIAALPTLASLNPGNVEKLSDGSFLTPNFGDGATSGELIQLNGTTVTTLTDANLNYKRIGLAVDSSGIYDCAFTKAGAVFTGYVEAVTLGTGGTYTETQLVTSTAGNPLAKLVGLTTTDTAVLVSDQTDNAIYAIDKTTMAITTYATITGPDLLFTLPDGSILTGGGTMIRRVATDGTVTNLALPPTFVQVHGIAYDPASKRLMVEDHGTAQDTLYVIPFTP